MKNFKLIDDLDSLFRDNKKAGIKNLLFTIHKLNQNSDKSFLLTRTYQVKGLNEYAVRKIRDVLTEYKFFYSRHIYKFNTTPGYNSEGEFIDSEQRFGYYYTLSNKFYKILLEFVKKEVNFVTITAKLSITDIKKLIKNLYKDTLFEIEKGYGATRYLFRLKGIMYCLQQSKGGPIINNISGYRRSYNIVEFNELIMKT